jgi:hypothetical protein
LLAHYEIEVDFRRHPAEQRHESGQNIDMQRFGDALDEDFPSLVPLYGAVK